MKKSLNRIQRGSIRRLPRANGKSAWEFRYFDPATNITKSKYFSTEEFPEQSSLEQHLKPFLIRLNSSDSNRLIIDPTMNDLLDYFTAEEKLIEIKGRKPGERFMSKDELSYSTVTSYLSQISRIRGKWGETKLDELQPLEVQQWLKALDLAPKTKGHLKAFLHRLFYKAELYGMITLTKNPIALVEIRGSSKRRKKPVSLTIEQFYLILPLLPEPYQTMAVVAQCTGLRVEEVLALFWSDIDFEDLSMKVQRAVVHGRIQWVKTEYSEDALPIDPDFASVLLDWKRHSDGSELVFPSHITGRCYHASPIQQDFIRPAGWCLVKCPECGAKPGTVCSGIKVIKSKRAKIPVHPSRRAAAEAMRLGSIGWHTFRHTYRTLLSGIGANLDVQKELMRHPELQTTMQYGGAPMPQKREANQKVVEMLLRRSQR
jgi:integrase